MIYKKCYLHIRHVFIFTAGGRLALQILEIKLFEHLASIRSFCALNFAALFQFLEKVVVSSLG